MEGGDDRPQLAGHIPAEAKGFEEVVDAAPGAHLAKG